MSPERWQQIEQLYHQALDRAPQQRAAFIAEASSGDGDLRAEVESLLARDASDRDLLLNRSATPVEKRLAPGMRLGPYEIETQLGAGGMGEVWKARDTRLGRSVAVKISKREFTQRFEREARAVAVLNHPHIATLYDVGPNYFVMEYVDGKPLQQLIPRKGLSLTHALALAAQIADALSAAHASGIVHRDLKPGNVMIANAGHVKVVDFGLAHVLPPVQQSPDDPTLTQTAEGTIAGTVAYMSPEQAQGRPVDARSDIFSFGAVLYEMLTGTRAFHGDSSVATLSEILQKEPPPVNDLPREVQTLMNRCLRKDPARRWQNMADVKVALLELKEDSESGRLSLTAPVLQRRRIHPAMLAAVGALVVLAVVAVWYAAHNNPVAEQAVPAIPITSYPGRQTQPSFSPDGSQVAFSWDGPQRDNWDIYVKVVGEGEPLRLTSDPASEASPAWSPDGRWIAFARELPDGRYAVVLISPLGGAQRVLGEFGGPEGPIRPSFAWSRDSKYLVVPLKEPERSRSGLFRLTVETGELVQLTSIDLREPGHTQPTLSPDGKLLAFYRTTALTLADFYVVNLSPEFLPNGSPRLLVTGALAGAVWGPDGKDLIYSGGPSMFAARLLRIDAAGKAPSQPVPGTGEGAFTPIIARPNGKGARLAWARVYADANIYRIDISEGPDKPGKPDQLIASVFRDAFAQYSPDGKTIAFYSGRSGLQEIWLCDADGSNARQLSHVNAPVSATPRWSPDGKQIVFDSDLGGVYQMYLISAQGGLAKRLTDPPTVNFGGNWSLDGRWLYFTSNRSGALNVWKMAAAGGPAEQITHDGGANPTVSPDGKFLYYIKQSNSYLSSLWRVPMQGGDEVQLVSKLHRFSYAVAARGIYYSVPLTSGTGGTIEFLDPETGRHAVLVHTDKRLDSGMGVSPDGRYLLYPQIDFEGANLMMIDNFR
jgi:serine/threonine protein kinase